MSSLLNQGKGGGKKLGKAREPDPAEVPAAREPAASTATTGNTTHAGTVAEPRSLTLPTMATIVAESPAPHEPLSDEPARPRQRR